MDDATVEIKPAPLLTDLRDLALQEGPDSGPKLRAGTDRLIIEAMRRVEGTPGSRLAAAEAARACRTLAEDIQESLHLHNAAAAEALAEARDAALVAIDRLEAQLAICSAPADIGKSRRRAFVRSSSVVMKKRRATFYGPPAKPAAAAD
jgi:hypothetical protein